MANLEGIKLALSQAGGAKASGTCAFKGCDELGRHSVSLRRAGKGFNPDKIAALLRVLRSAVVDAGQTQKR